MNIVWSLNLVLVGGGGEGYREKLRMDQGCDFVVDGSKRGIRTGLSGIDSAVTSRPSPPRHFAQIPSFFSAACPGGMLFKTLLCVVHCTWFCSGLCLCCICAYYFRHGLACLAAEYLRWNVLARLCKEMGSPVFLYVCFGRCPDWDGACSVRLFPGLVLRPPGK